MTLDTSYHEKRLRRQLEDPQFRGEFERAEKQIAQVDEVVRALDDLRIELRMSKAELARRIGKNPASIRRLFTSESNPELSTIAAIAAVLNARIKVEPIRRSRQTSGRMAAV